MEEIINFINFEDEINLIRKELENFKKEIKENDNMISKRIEKLGKVLEEQGEKLEKAEKELEEQVGKELEEQEEKIEKVEKEIEEQGEKIEKVEKEIEEQGEKIQEQGKKIEIVGKEIEDHGKKIEKVEKEIEEININLPFIIRLFESLQNTNNNNDENGILNDLEELEFNEKFKNEEEIKCAICLETISIGDKISYLPCIHLFHSSCIKNWVRIKNKCPICNNIIKFS